MPLYEVTVQWLSRRKIVVETADESSAEKEAEVLFLEEFHTEPLAEPEDVDILISDVERIS